MQPGHGACLDYRYTYITLRTVLLGSLQFMKYNAYASELWQLLLDLSFVLIIKLMHKGGILNLWAG